MPATKGAAWYPTAHSCTTSDTNESSHPEVELQRVANQSTKQSISKNETTNSWYAAAETNQLEPMHSRNKTRFPVSWLRTPTVRLNLDLALPH